MIMFERFTLICDECGGDSVIGVTNTVDGDATIVAQCNECDEIERLRTEIAEVQ